MTSGSSFGVWDWVVFVAMLVLSAAIGIYFAFAGGTKKTSEELLMGKRSMGFIPIAISIIVSFQSAILVLGVPAEMYTQGAMYFLGTVGYFIGGLLATFVFVPLFYPLELTSVYQYLEERYKSKSVRLIGSLLSIIATITFTGLASYAPATALMQVSGFEEWKSFIIIGVVCTFYTIMGGLKAVVWVDTFQAVIMIAGILAITIQSIISADGMANVWAVNDQWNRLNFWNFDPDPTVRHTFWSLIIANILTTFGFVGTTQASVQRFCATKSTTDAKKAVIVNLVGNFFMQTLACLCGIGVFAYYAMQGCDPISDGQVTNINQLIPHFVMELLAYPGVPGLFIACLFSGALSSLSTNLSSLCAQTWEDVIQPIFHLNSEKRKTMVIRILIFVYGAAGVGMTFFISNLEGTILQVTTSFIGVGAGPLTGLVVLGCFFPWANWLGALIGSIAAYAIAMWIALGKYTLIGEPLVLPFPTDNCSSLANMTMTSVNVTMTTPVELTPLETLYSLSYLWYGPIGLFVCLILGLVVSFVSGPTDPADVDPKYLVPIVARLTCCKRPCGRKRGLARREAYEIKETKMENGYSNGDSKRGYENQAMDNIDSHTTAKL